MPIDEKSLQIAQSRHADSRLAKNQSRACGGI
jgi:hypothetical protein